MGRTAKRSRKPSGGYVAYYRVSTDRQGKSGLGLEAQREAVARHLASRKATLVSEYTEVESGKRHDNRPQLAAAIGEAKRLGATLLIAKLDRLARNVHFISGLMESAAAFEACDMPHANKFTIHILAAVAEHEREMISERTKAALAAAKARGTKLGNPRWQESIHKATAARKKPLPSAELAAIVAGYRAEGFTLRAIAKRMNELGLKTASGAQWHASSVHKALAA